MPKFFYMDCSITNPLRTNLHAQAFTVLINGQKAEQLAMDNQTYHHILGADKNTISRVWLYDPGFRKLLTIAAVGNIEEPQHITRNSSLVTIYPLVVRPLIAGLLAWFFAWVVLAVPVLNIYGSNAHSGVSLLEKLTVMAGLITAAIFFAYSLWTKVKLSHLDSWAHGEISTSLKEESQPGKAVTTRKKVAAELMD